MKRIPGLMIAAIAVATVAGCAGSGGLNAAYTKPEMMDKGIIYILPGIQGVDYHYLNMRNGLQGAGIKCAIKIHPWGCHIPGIGMAINETDTADDRGWGQKIAQEILTYQRQYPGRPVYMIGQSGGCAVSVFTTEALATAGAPQISGMVLLDASLSADYDLSSAKAQCRKGIVNFYNLNDVAMLEVGTKIFGNLDGGHGDSAGRTGFTDSGPKLFQVQVTQDMVSRFESPHFADTSAAFTTHYIAPWVIARNWPMASPRQSLTAPRD